MSRGSIPPSLIINPSPISGEQDKRLEKKKRKEKENTDKCNRIEKEKLIKQLLKPLKFKPRFSDFESNILQTRMTAAWFRKIIDVPGDGNCLIYCLFLLFPDVAIKVVEDISTDDVCIALLVYNLRNSIRKWAEKLSEEHENGVYDRAYGIMLSMYFSGNADFIASMPGYNAEVVTEFSDALNTSIVPFGMNELERYVSDNTINADK